MFVREDDSTLAVFIGPHEPANQVDLALPYAFEHVGDRDLWLVVPHGLTWPFEARLPWIRHHVRLFSFEFDEMVEVPIPTTAAVHARIRSTPTAKGLEISPERLGWVDEVVAWADGHPRLLPSHRASYLGWQVDGRLALKIEATSKGVRITAGTTTASSLLVRELEGPLANPEPIRSAVRASISERLHGDDTANLEHRFQARLRGLPVEARLGLETFLPEYPAMRPRGTGQKAGSMDFLGVDGEHRLHVVETKVGAADPMAALQALDYWVWATANQQSLAEDLDADPKLTPALSVITLPGPDGRLWHERNSAIAARLDRSVPLQVWEGRTELSGALRLTSADRSRFTTRDRFTDRLRTAVRSAADLPRPGTPSAVPVSIASWARDPYETLDARGDLHSYVRLPYSSQRFALELYGLLDEGGCRRLLARHFGAIETASICFEWTDPDDLLREATSARPYRTQVDVLIEGETIAGERVAMFIEVKLTEDEFGGCSHADESPNPATCATDGSFGDDPSTCWQLLNRGLGPSRRYDEVLTFEQGPTVDQWSDGPPLEMGAGCWWRRRNQPMRLAALAEAQAEAGRLDDYVVALTAPAGHGSIRRRWAEAASVNCAPLVEVSPEEVLGAAAVPNPPDGSGLGHAGEIQELVRRYQLGPRTWFISYSLPELEPIAWRFVAYLLEHHPGMGVIETHPGGGMYDCLTLAYFTEVFIPARHVDLNLAGSVHALGDAEVTREAWSFLAGGWLKEVGRQVAGWSSPPASHRPMGPKSWPHVAAFVAQRYRRSYRWRNFVDDTSGYGGGPRTHYLEDFDELAETLAKRRRSDLLANYQLWFLVPGDREGPNKPVAAIDTVTDTGIIPGIRSFDLTNPSTAATFRKALEDAVGY